MAGLRIIADPIAKARAHLAKVVHECASITLRKAERDRLLRPREFRRVAAPAVGKRANEPGGLAVHSRDTWTRKSLMAAIAAAFLLHAGVFLLFFVELPKKGPSPEPSSIPVELVMLPPPKPVAPSAPQHPLPQQSKKESGGDPDRAAGQSPDVAPERQAEPEPAEAPTPVRPPPPPTPPAAAATPESPPNPKQTATALPRTHRAPAPLRNDSALPGEGGGDRYLNAMRDRIESSLEYPIAARSLRLNGVAIYDVVLDRQGRLIAVEIRLSSGESILDMAGTNAIRRGAPFGPVPSDVPGERIEIEVRLPMEP
jgi:periplasmic protein TonB